jgi:hypothetical protein
MSCLVVRILPIAPGSAGRRARETERNKTLPHTSKHCRLDYLPAVFLLRVEVFSRRNSGVH